MNRLFPLVGPRVLFVVTVMASMVVHVPIIARRLVAMSWFDWMIFVSRAVGPVETRMVMLRMWVVVPEVAVIVSV